MELNKLHKDLHRLVDHMWQSEKHNWEEQQATDEHYKTNHAENHIFHSINNIKNYLIGKEK